MTKLIRTTIPFIIFLGLVVLLWSGLSLNPRKIPSALLNKSAPAFHLTTLFDEKTPFTQQDLQGKVSLVNVWASWCVACRDEHPILMEIARQNRVPIFAIDYKDKRAAAKQWMQKFGNPYKKIGFDGKGDVAINWGVYGTPETYLVDQHGIIRYKHVGPMTLTIWQKEFLPRIKKLQKLRPPSSSRGLTAGPILRTMDPAVKPLDDGEGS